MHFANFFSTTTWETERWSNLTIKHVFQVGWNDQLDHCCMMACFFAFFSVLYLRRCWQQRLHVCVPYFGTRHFQQRRWICSTQTVLHKCRLDAVPFPCIARQAERGVVTVIWWSLPKSKGTLAVWWKNAKSQDFQNQSAISCSEKVNMFLWTFPTAPLLGEAHGCHLQIQHHSLHPLGPPCWRDSKWSSIALPAMTWQLGSNRRMEISGKTPCCQWTL